MPERLRCFISENLFQRARRSGARSDREQDDVANRNGGRAMGVLGKVLGCKEAEKDVKVDAKDKGAWVGDGVRRNVLRKPQSG